jgi:hypothetical protein
MRWAPLDWVIEAMPVTPTRSMSETVRAAAGVWNVSVLEASRVRRAMAL